MNVTAADQIIQSLTSLSTILVFYATLISQQGIMQNDHVASCKVTTCAR